MGGGRPALDQAASGEPGSEPSPHPWLIPPDAECQRMFGKGQRPWQRPSVPLPVLPCAGTRRSAGVFVRPHVVLCAWDRARPPVTVGELRSRCAHTFVPVRLLSVGVGGRAACISACVWTRAAPRRDAVLVHLGGHCEGACHCRPGRGGRAGGGRTPVSARRIWTHGWGATGVGVAGGSSWPVTSVAVSRSPAQVGAGISSHLYHGRGGGWA